MKRTRKKLGLEKLTIRLLQPTAVETARGGIMKSHMTECSGSCMTCGQTCDCNWTERCSNHCA